MSRKKVTVGTTVSRVIEDDKLPGSVKTGVIKALYEEGELVDYMLEELASGVGVKAKRMYEYAKSGEYTWGLPSGQFTTGEEGRAEVQAVLNAIEGTPVILEYAHYGPPNNLHIGWTKLIASHGYNPATNQLGVLTASKGTPVYLKDMVVVIPASQVDQIDTRSLEQWGLAAKSGYTPERTSITAAARPLVLPSPVQKQTGGTSEYLKVTYVWMVGAVLNTGTFNIDITGYNEDANYFHAKYLKGGVTKYWMYEDGAGTYSTLDQAFDFPPVPNGSFFPFVYFRYDKDSENDDKTTDAYKTSVKITKLLGMDYDQIADAINQNPDIDDVEHAIMMMAVPANTENELERRYLFEFFDTLYAANALQYRSKAQQQIALGQKPAELGSLTSSIVIQDTRFKMALENDAIYKRRVAGSIGPVGSYDSGFSEDGGTLKVVDTVTGVVSTITTPGNYHYFRRQVSTGFYDEIAVVELQTRFHVQGKYSTIGDEEEKILLIPVDLAITSIWSLPNRELLYARALHYVFNSYVVTKVKWYQTGIFKLVMIVVAIVIVIWSGGTGFQVAAGLLAAGLYTAAALVIIGMVLEYIVMALAFKLFVKAVGTRAALVVAIVAAASGTVMAINAGGLAGAPWSNQLLSLSSGLSNAIDVQMAADMKQLGLQARDFEAYKQEQLEILETAQGLLENNTWLSPFTIFGEKPQEYYDRTVHSGNIGVVGIDAVSTFVESKLVLPKLSDTFGGEYAGNL